MLFPEEGRHIHSRLTTEDFAPLISSGPLEQEQEQQKSYNINQLSTASNTGSCGSPQLRFNISDSDNLRYQIPSVSTDLSLSATTTTSASSLLLSPKPSSYQNPFGENSTQQQHHQKQEQYQVIQSSIAQASPRFKSTGINSNNSKILNNSSSRERSDSPQSEVTLKTNNIRPAIPLFNPIKKHSTSLETMNTSFGMKPDSILHLHLEIPQTDTLTEMSRNIDSLQVSSLCPFSRPIDLPAYGADTFQYFGNTQGNAIDLTHEVTTVSPRDIMMDAGASSRYLPPSAGTFTNYSTPGSRIFDSDYDTSSQFINTNSTLMSTIEVDPTESREWTSLFPAKAEDQSTDLVGFQTEASVFDSGPENQSINNISDFFPETSAYELGPPNQLINNHNGYLSGTSSIEPGLANQPINNDTSGFFSGTSSLEPGSEDHAINVDNFQPEASVSMSRTTSDQRFSSSVGITKQARRTKVPLMTLRPDLEPDPKNKKRMKNTEAARKSRAKKDWERDESNREIDRLRAELELRDADVSYWRARFLASEKKNEELIQQHDPNSVNNTLNQIRF